MLSVRALITMRGPRGRMEFAKGMESRYGDRRKVDDERPMYDMDGSHDTDETSTYYRGGWVFWMVYDYLGHERALQVYHGRRALESAGHGRGKCSHRAESRLS